MDDEQVVTMPSNKLRVIDVAILVLDTVSVFVERFTELLCSHANYKVDRRQMESEARADIERIVGGE